MAKATEIEKAKMRERRNGLIEIGICVHCGEYEAVKGKTLCEVCLVEQSISTKKYRDKLPEEKHKQLLKQINQNMKRLYRDRKDNGLCVRCGKPANPEGTIFCWECRRKDNRTRKQKRLAKSNGIEKWEWAAYGLCTMCGKPNDGNTKVCNSCKEKLTKNLQKAIASKKK